MQDCASVSLAQRRAFDTLVMSRSLKAVQEGYQNIRTQPEN